MNAQRSWLVELKWWLSSLAALLAILLIFALIRAALSIVTLDPSDAATSGITNQYGDALSGAGWWPLAAILVFPPYLFAAALGFRLLVPTFAGAPPRAVAVIVTTWPVALGAALISADLPFTVFFVAMAAVWAMVMPLAKKTLLSNNPVWGGAVVGLAFSSLAEIVGVEWAILWCAVRLYRGKSLEVAATAVCAAAMPALFLASQLPQASLGPRALYLIAEVVILGGLSLAGFLLSRRPRRDTEPAVDTADGASDAAEVAES